MLDANTMRQACERYVAAINADDADAVLALFSDDPTVEDPVGGTPFVGRQAVEEFYRWVATLGVRMTIDGAVRGSHGNAAAMPLLIDREHGDGDGGGKVAVGHSGATRGAVIDVMTFDDDGRIARMQAFWAPDDIKPR